MENIYLYAGIVSIVYFVIKFVEMRFVNKENKPLKVLIRDTVIVFVCSILANFIFEQFDTVKDLVNLKEPTNVFTGPAEF